MQRVGIVVTRCRRPLLAVISSIFSFASLRVAGADIDAQVEHSEICEQTASCQNYENIPRAASFPANYMKKRGRKKKIQKL